MNGQLRDSRKKILMFDDDDAKKMSFTRRIPDGIIDGSQYANIFQKLFNDLKEIKQDDGISNMTWIMKCVNECYKDNNNGTSSVDASQATDTVTALAYFVMTLIRGIDERDLEEYYRFHEEEVIPDMMANAQTIPWYDIMDEVKAMMDFFDDLDDSIESEENDDN